MSNYKNFQSDNFKYTSEHSRTDIYNPEFNSNVKINSNKDLDIFNQNIDKWITFISWCRWHPDLWFDLITPETGGIRLDLDQRVYLRSLSRFLSTYGVFPRGYGKTLKEVMGMYHTAIFFPDIEISMTAQTRENAVRILEDKHRELIKFYPLLQNEITKASFSKDTAEIIFTSGGRVDVLANQQSTKGQRRKRLNVEESALLNNELFKDALEPVVNVPRRTIGKQALINPEELNGQINFFTTSGYKGTDEYIRSLKMVKEMADLKGKMVLGSDWQLAVHYGRGETRSQILTKKDDPTTSAITFAQNYESKWVGCGEDALVDIGKVIKLRTLSRPELKPEKGYEYVVAMDVARSQSQNNNQSAIIVLKLIKNKQGLIKQANLVNMIVPPNGTNFYDQALLLKKTVKNYNAIIAVIDALNVGQGVIDNCLKDLVDPETNEIYESWATVNTDHQPENPDAPKMIYAIIASAINTNAIVNFLDYVEHGKLRLLVNHKEVSGKDADNLDVLAAHINTDVLIEEISNLRLIVQKTGGKLSIERVTKKIDKDRMSATMYGLYWIKLYNEELSQNNSPIEDSMYFLSFL